MIRHIFCRPGFSAPAIALLAICYARSTPAQPAEAICANRDLRAAVDLIESSCSDVTCDVRKLQELDTKVDKPSLLGALAALGAVHLFFPDGLWTLEEAFDWQTSGQRGKRAQLDSLALRITPESEVFILGRASKTRPSATLRFSLQQKYGIRRAMSDDEINTALSLERMRSIHGYLKTLLSARFPGAPPCKIRGAWIGNLALQLTMSEAAHLNLWAGDFRYKEDVLNQAVHVFVYPCGSRTSSRQGGK